MRPTSPAGSGDPGGSAPGNSDPGGGDPGGGDLAPLIVDGIGMLCVRLLIRLRGVVAEAEPGTVVHVLTTDPAAPIDLPAWCHLTGHTYLGPVGQDDRCVVHALRVVAGARRTRPDRPWHPDPEDH